MCTRARARQRAREQRHFRAIEAADNDGRIGKDMEMKCYSKLSMRCLNYEGENGRNLLLAWNAAERQRVLDDLNNRIEFQL